MMQQELLDITGKGFPAEREIEQCFAVCNRYLTYVRAVALEPQEEVNFNKNVLPLFIAEAEYYSYLSYARLFRPANTLEEQLLFWKREEGRFLKFTEEHKEFLDHYRNGKTNMDQIYFGEAVNPYGTIISGYMALKKYTQYVRDELDVLSGFSK